MSNSLDQFLRQMAARAVLRLTPRWRNRDDVEDAVSGAVEAYLTRQPAIADADHLCKWLTVVAHRRLLDETRCSSAAAHALSASDLWRPDNSSANTADHVVMHIILFDAWEHLAPIDKQTLAARVQGLSCDDLAILFHVSKEAAKKMLQRARFRFQRELIEAGLSDLLPRDSRLPRIRDLSKRTDRQTGERQPMSDSGPDLL
jgi:DNA-directed RNA polymerase specialized sigma24 family protein